MSQITAHEMARVFTDLIFQKYDLDHSGSLEPHELALLMRDSFLSRGKNRNISEGDVKQFMR